MRAFALSSLTTLISLISTSLADPATYSSSTVSTSIALTQNGSATDLYMRLSAPASNGWGGVAIGEQMGGSLFFIIYPSADSNDVTLSVRTAGGNQMPMEYDGAEYQVMDSKVEDGMMMVDFACYGCSEWDGGNLDTSSSSAGWLWAHGPGTSISSDSTSARIQQHPLSGGGYGQFSANMERASYPSSTEASAAISGSSSSSSSGQSGNEESSNAASSSSGSSSNTSTLITAHATLLTLTFYLFLPLGILLLRLSPAIPVRLHYIINTLATFLAIAGLAIAITMSKQQSSWSKLNHHHQIIGITVVSALIVQALLGIGQHIFFVKTGRKIAIRWVHVILGWGLVILGGLQGILGARWKGDNKLAGGLGAVMAVVWVGTYGGAMAGRWLRGRREGKGKHSHTGVGGREMKGGG